MLIPFNILNVCLKLIQPMLQSLVVKIFFGWRKFQSMNHHRLSWESHLNETKRWVNHKSKFFSTDDRFVTWSWTNSFSVRQNILPNKLVAMASWVLLNLKGSMINASHQSASVIGSIPRKQTTPYKSAIHLDIGGLTSDSKTKESSTSNIPCNPFGMGVPVTHQRFTAGKRQAIFAKLQFTFSTICASSRHTLHHSIRINGHGRTA